MHLLAGYTWNRLHTGTMFGPSSPCCEAIQLNLPCMTVAPLELLPLYWRPGKCLQVSDFVCSPFKRASVFPPSSVSPGWTERALADFHSQMLWELLFLAQDPWAGKPSVGLGPLPLPGLPSPRRRPSQCSTTICGLGVSLFCIFTSPTSLDVASSLDA